MSEQSSQIDLIREGYTFTDPSIVLGGAVGTDGDAVVSEAVVRLPLASMNRHGLVAGATGTGKTVTLQVLAEQLSDAGVPVFLADIKGDLTGLATPATGGGRIEERMGELAVQCLLETRSSSTRVLPHRLVERGTTARARSVPPLPPHPDRVGTRSSQGENA